MTGIMIIATKHPYYGRMAFNLAATIKASDKECPVCIMHSGRGLAHLTEGQKEIFDYHVEISDNENGVGTKLFAIDHSPFDSTLLIDADNLWFRRKPSELFDELKDYDFTAINEGVIDYKTGENNLRTDYFMWANVDQIKEAYGLHEKKMYQYRSEIMWFKKTETIISMFRTAQEIFLEPKVESVLFGGVVPDELPLNISCAIHGVAPHKYKWQPCFWDRIHKLTFHQKQPKELFQNYWLMSTGGNNVTATCIKLYNRLAGAACYKLGLQFMFTLQPKKRVIEERKIM